MSGATLQIREATGPGPNEIWLDIVPDLPPEGFSLDAQGGGLSILGGAERGVMYGCYSLLEDDLGCRWYNTRVAKIPKRSTIRLPELHRKEAPAFEYREPFYTEAFDKDWAARNRLNGNSMHLDESVGGKVSYGRFVHTFSELVPPEKYFSTHPEWFSMVDGKRQSGYAQLCLTNPEVLQKVIEGVEKWIVENPKATIFSVSQNDTDYHCQCDNCKAVEKEEGAPSGVLLRFVNAVADEVGKKYPNVLIDTLAYQWSEKPPLHVRPHKNVRIRIAPIGACVSHPMDGCEANASPLKNLKDWAKITGQLYIWAYSTNFANYLQPLPDLDELSADPKLFRDSGVVGLFYEGDYSPGGGGEMSELKAYLLAKLMWNPDRPAKPIIADYVNGVYGRGAPYISKWLTQLHEGPRKRDLHAYIYDQPNAKYLAPDLIAKGLALFDEAAKATEADASAHDEVRRARIALEYVQLMQLPWKYEVSGGQYKPFLDDKRKELGARLAEDLRRYGIGQVSEGGSTDSFLQRIGQTPSGIPVLSLDDERLHVDVLPNSGARILRVLDKRTGRNILRDPVGGEAPQEAGYEEYTGEAYRSPGWSEKYTGAMEGGRLTLTGRTANGLEITKNLWLDSDGLHMSTSVKNLGDKPIPVTLRSHPEIALPAGDSMVALDSGDKVALSGHQFDRFFEGDQAPKRWWEIREPGLTVRQSFPVGTVGKALLDYYPGRAQANLCLYGKPVTLQPGEQTELQQVWTVSSS